MLLSEPMVTVLTTIAYLSSSWLCTEPTFTVHILEKAAEVAE
jgi:hypothetical protein